MRNFMKLILGSTLMVSLSACGTLSSTMGGGGGGNLDAFIQASQAASDLSSTSSTQLAQAVLSKDAYDKLTARRTAAMSISDPKEKEAEIEAVQSDTLAEADKAKKAATRAGTFNFMLSLLRATDVVKQGTNIVKNPPTNPALVTKVNGVRESVADLNTLVNNMSSIAGKVTALAKAGEITLPTSASEQTVELSM
jgi:hypothetical protein